MSSQHDSTTSHTPLSSSRAIRNKAVRATVTITDSGHMYTADQSTGEIIHATRKLPSRRIERKIEIYVGSDTKFPSQARDSEELHAAITPFDTWPDKQYFNPAKAIELLGAGASGIAVRTLGYLAQNLAGRWSWSPPRWTAPVVGPATDEVAAEASAPSLEIGGRPCGLSSRWACHR